MSSAPDLQELLRQHREQGRLLREARRASGVTPYELHKQYVAEKRREATRASQDIYPIPEIVDKVRRQAGIDSFVEFCRIYLHEQFSLPWSPYHHKAAEKIERAVTSGGLFAFAMPRGSGKTTLSRAGVLWAVLSGHCRCVVLLAAAERSAERHLKYGLKRVILRNKLLLDDFPHAIYPFRKMEGEARAGAGQLYRGEKTFVEWAANHITFAWVPEAESLSSGAVIETMGMTAEIRGPLYTLPDGTQMRPQLVIADDPQTRESSRSATQSQSRIDTLMGDVAYLAGPAKPIAVVCTCTVIHEGDMADQLLNRDIHPEWQGERTKMVERFPVNMHLWDKYGDILRQSQREESTPEACNDFYRANWDEMNKGGAVSWPERHREDELSGLQHAMNWKIRNEAMFWAECQNEPVTPQEDVHMLGVDELCSKITGFDRLVIPPDVTTLTAFTDVQMDHLFWMLCGWSPQFTGYVLDYGAWPEQRSAYFSRATIRTKLSHKYRGDDSGIMFSALDELGAKLAGARYTTADMRELTLARWCIDGGYKARVGATEFYVAQSPHKPIITITKGFGVRAGERPFSQSPRAVEQRIGPFEWYWRDGRKNGGWVSFDANFWKTRVHAALSLATGSRGSIQLFRAQPYQHKMLAEHLRAEKPTRVTAKGTTVVEWREIPGRDNEGLDCLVGCMLGASIQGIAPPNEQKPKARTVVKPLSEWAAMSKGK